MMNEVGSCTDSILFTKWDEPENEQEKKVDSLAQKAFQYYGMEIGTCKKNKHKVEKLNPQKANVWSIITGLGISALGVTISFVCPPAGAIVTGLGISIMANAVVDEINKGFEEPKKENQKIPEEAKKYPVYNAYEYGVEV